MAERGVGLCAPIHDAILVEGPADSIDLTVANAQAAMREASAIVLGGFELETDADVVSYPNRYSDERGTEMWTSVLSILAELDPVRFGTTRNQTGRGLAPNGTGCLSYLLSNNESSLNK
jgi:hypothetical protein